MSYYYDDASSLFDDNAAPQNPYTAGTYPEALPGIPLSEIQAPPPPAAPAREASAREEKKKSKHQSKQNAKEERKTSAKRSGSQTKGRDSSAAKYEYYNANPQKSASVSKNRPQPKPVVPLQQPLPGRQQQRPFPMLTSWHYSMCHCCQDCSSCLEAWCCRSCQISRQYNMIRKGMPEMDCLCCVGMCLCSFCLGCLPMCIGTCMTRQRIRERYGIGGVLAGLLPVVVLSAVRGATTIARNDVP
ncbi:ama1 protein [Angomonas deanei]|uniref:PLAC8 family, putative n=1 Tax=Angomonas deanei TaxID=59799 RepID=A0A7G2CE98_9TRYP|nr:ama1 protein [Angomonas deanei]CAD2218180.1 PLAC8 family, putative [Angomonas deanei]|eukprot:EPY37532.1 ama1 protein [Angomonas deanei]